MELINYLKQNGLEKLQQEFKIKATFSQKYPQLVCLKYNQIDSPMKEKVVQQCRGVILDTADDWKIISYPYDKFFNYGEGDGVNFYHEKIDWDSARVYEKLDGSLMTLYYYNGEWLVQSSSNPDASGRVNGFDFSFAELFWKVWDELGYRLPDIDPALLTVGSPGSTRFSRRCCYMFELITKFNRIVIPSEQNRLVFHGMRYLQDSSENFIDDWDFMGWEIVKQYPLSSWDSVLQSSKEIPAMESEGYVVCDKYFNRIKVKSPAYCALHHLKHSASPLRMLQVVVQNEDSEFLSYFPELLEEFTEIKTQYQKLIDIITQKWLDVKDIPDQKCFALAVKDFPYAGSLFQLKKDPSKSVSSLLAATKLDYVKKAMENV